MRKHNRSLVVRLSPARMMTDGVLHIVTQKVAEQLVTHIVVTYWPIKPIPFKELKNAKTLPLHRESGLNLLPQGKGDRILLARFDFVDCRLAWRV